MVNKWDYGGAYKNFDINSNSVITVDDNNYLKVHDMKPFIKDYLSASMR